MSRRVTAEDVWIAAVRNWDEGFYYVPSSLAEQAVTFFLVDVGLLKTNPVWSIFWPASRKYKSAAGVRAG